MQNKRILITGASSGIGRALALKLAASGNEIVALARNPQKLKALVAENPAIETIALDLADPQALRDFADNGWNGRLDVLINNAGVQDQHRFDDPACSAEVMIEEATTNLVAPIVLTRALLPQLLEGKTGTVVNIVSALAFAPKDNAACYSATKAGLKMFSAALRAQFPPDRLRVLDIFPPLVATAMTKGRGKGKITPEAAADAIIAALDGSGERALIGSARVIAVLSAMVPGLATKLMSR
ncbi:MAG: SDR family NAD(P)-dependent oxidoreductase [Salaquimonas sp.]|jgi:short-subunit dehydrogenase involved in D-alanine esterification of teichoic acids|nr:SDR family NAD(P)-dependent oxidoreductase [Salaquimonas sp.]